jgi:hypothetical protein
MLFRQPTKIYIKLPLLVKSIPTPLAQRLWFIPAIWVGVARMVTMA